MMEGLDQIYDRAFFAQWGRHHDKYVLTAQNVAAFLFQEFQPRRILDLGSGCGIYSHLFREKGVAVVAIDGVRPPPEESYPGEIFIRDLTEPIENLWGEFDFTLCFDVAEHIPEEFLDPFLENLTRFSPTLLLSAAPPNQGGTHHVNERPKKYWKAQLARHGFTYDRKRTGKVIEHFKRHKPGFMWMCQHICVYERRTA